MCSRLRSRAGTGASQRALRTRRAGVPSTSRRATSRHSASGPCGVRARRSRRASLSRAASRGPSGASGFGSSHSARQPSSLLQNALLRGVTSSRLCARAAVRPRAVSTVDTDISATRRRMNKFVREKGGAFRDIFQREGSWGSCYQKRPSCCETQCLGPRDVRSLSQSRPGAGGVGM